MKQSEIACGFTLVGSMLLSGCYYSDYFGQQGSGYGDPYEQQSGYSTNDAYARQGSQAYAESGDVVTLPGDGYGDGGTDDFSSSSSAGSSYGNTGGSGNSYTVVKGDNLYNIGEKFDVRMQEIMRANGLTDSTIYPGQELRIP